MTIRLNKAVKMSNDVDLGRIYKGEEYDVTIPIPFSGEVTEFQLYFYTDSAATIDIPLSRILIEDGYGTIHFQDDEFDPINDGVLKYYLKWSLDGKEHITCTNTLHYLKTADGYNPRTVEEMVSEAYDSGITYQKSLLVSTAITDNGVYEREDGFSSVDVNIHNSDMQSKNYNITENGDINITVDDGYDGITGGTIHVSVGRTEDVDFLCFTAEEANSTVSLNIGEYVSLNLYVSTDNQQTFTQWDGSQITLANIGDKVYIYGENEQISYNSVKRNICTFQLTGKIAASGNIESLLNRKGVDYIPPFCFYSLFSGCTSLTTAPQLPATNIGPYCYYSMFRGCTSLTSAPQLPATNIGPYCYGYMFYSCTSLTTAPQLPATTLATHCCAQMFYGCTSLTTAPQLPATTLADGCYIQMFQQCSSLNYIKVGATAWNTSSTVGWVLGVSASGTFVKPTDTEIPSGGDGIPNGWSVVNE